MDYAAAARRYKKGNKENTEPGNRVQSFIKNKIAAQLHQKINSKKGIPDVKSQQPDGKDTTDGTHVQRQLQLAAASENGPKYSPAFLTEQHLKGEKTVREFSKPTFSVVASKPTAGMYKGKIVESKIACIWKLSSTVEIAQAASSTLKYENPKSTNLEKKSRPKSVSDRPADVPRSVATSYPWIGSSCSSTRTVSAPLTSISYRNRYMGSDGTQNLKPKVPEADKMVTKPRSSIYSQTRFTMETKERRAKLADWQASKGKTLKRPAIKIAKTKVFETKQVKSHFEPDTQHNTKDFLKAQEVLPTGHFLKANNQSPVEAQHMGDPIVKHSAPTEVIAASPRSEDESAQVENVSNNAELEDRKPKDECQEGLKYEMKDVSKKLQVAQVKMRNQSLAVTEKEMESKVERLMEPMPQRENTSMVKYSVTTTPYLQSVKKTLDDARTSASKKTGSIKDLKFLTPVRRSCRIQRKSSHLPAMLQDHDPCVNSLAELVTLDDSPNAFIYRKNPALTEYVRPAKTEIC